MGYFFGLRLATTGPIWGARAIDANGDVNLVWDRQQAEGGEDERRHLGGWLDNYALPRLRREAIDLHDGPPHNTVTFADGGYVLQARRRGGYFYIGACHEKHYQPTGVNGGHLMIPYTAVAVVPDSMVLSYGQDVLVVWVSGPSDELAMDAAREKAAGQARDRWGSGSVADDWFISAMFCGHTTPSSPSAKKKRKDPATWISRR